MFSITFIWYAFAFWLLLGDRDITFLRAGKAWLYLNLRYWSMKCLKIAFKLTSLSYIAKPRKFHLFLFTLIWSSLNGWSDTKYNFIRFLATPIGSCISDNINFGQCVQSVAPQRPFPDFFNSFKYIDKVYYIIDGPFLSFDFKKCFKTWQWSSILMYCIIIQWENYFEVFQ